MIVRSGVSISQAALGLLRTGQRGTPRQPWPHWTRRLWSSGGRWGASSPARSGSCSALSWWWRRYTSWVDLGKFQNNQAPSPKYFIDQNMYKECFFLLIPRLWLWKSSFDSTGGHVIGRAAGWRMELWGGQALNQAAVAVSRLPWLEERRPPWRRRKRKAGSIWKSYRYHHATVRVKSWVSRVLENSRRQGWKASWTLMPWLRRKQRATRREWSKISNYVGTLKTVKNKMQLQKFDGCWKV